MRPAKILALEPVTVGTVVPQADVFDAFYADLYAEVPTARELFLNTQVKTRHMAWDPREVYANGFPGMAERMAVWERNVLDLGRRSAGKVLAGVDRDRVGSYTMASCTGYAGPTPEMLLAKELGLRDDLRRTFVGHMGCYAAFNTLKVALDSLAARPDDLALLTCAEICSVHLRPEVTREQVVVSGLFGDAGASMVLAAAEPDEDGPVVLATHTETHYETSHAMTWTVRDDAFRMTLSPYVPLFLSEAVRPFTERLLAKAGLTPDEVEHWAVHPGGPKIIDFVGERLSLTPEQLQPSLDVLADYGNCSSPTVLLILHRILTESRPAPGSYAVLMAFGPGLTMESALVRF
ncbi:type III polyketide synthase [Actinokineospora spheciospongiae]|uniref:type III polyketide synthase n=1 Tax=Actinokineospora spheciospongiae TaxID=909613 RepID=UPI000D718B90|nr:type III polyketide synthase [Actinokineospora spheciospongiae]PWW53035.1 putative naringenin-chalcone synthase [Actinokineospora spheciospongiae]